MTKDQDYKQKEIGGLNLGGTKVIEHFHIF